jgi:membrane-bound ClpP family serine protease
MLSSNNSLPVTTAQAHILEMASNNEIDQALMDLLTQNIEAARAAEQVRKHMAAQGSRTPWTCLLAVGT